MPRGLPEDPHGRIVDTVPASSASGAHGDRAAARKGRYTVSAEGTGEGASSIRRWRGKRPCAGCPALPVPSCPGPGPGGGNGPLPAGNPARGPRAGHPPRGEAVVAGCGAVGGDVPGRRASPDASRTPPLSSRPRRRQPRPRGRATHSPRTKGVHTHTRGDRSERQAPGTPAGPTLRRRAPHPPGTLSRRSRRRGRFDKGSGPVRVEAVGVGVGVAVAGTVQRTRAVGASTREGRPRPYEGRFVSVSQSPGPVRKVGVPNPGEGRDFEARGSGFRPPPGGGFEVRWTGAQDRSSSPIRSSPLVSPVGRKPSLR